MTIPRLKELNKHWQEFPPSHVQLNRLATYFGLKPAETASKNSKGLNDFIADFMAAGGKVNMPQQGTHEHE